MKRLAPRLKARLLWISPVDEFEFEQNLGQPEEIAVERDNLEALNWWKGI